MTITVPARDKLPDSPSWTNRFEHHSGSGHTYVIAQNRAKRFFGCTCQAWTFRRHCKHLDEYGLPGSEMPCDAEVVALRPSPPQGGSGLPSLPRVNLQNTVDILDALGIGKPARSAAPAVPSKPSRRYRFDD